MKSVLDREAVGGVSGRLLAGVKPELVDDHNAQRRAGVVAEIALVFLDQHPFDRLPITEEIMRKA